MIDYTYESFVNDTCFEIANEGLYDKIEQR